MIPARSRFCADGGEHGGCYMFDTEPYRSECRQKCRLIHRPTTLFTAKTFAAIAPMVVGFLPADEVTPENAADFECIIGKPLADAIRGRGTPCEATNDDGGFCLLDEGHQRPHAWYKPAME